MGIQRQSRFRLIEQFANHTGHVLVPWFNDKAMAGGGTLMGWREKRNMIFKKSLLRKARVSKID